MDEPFFFIYIVVIGFWKEDMDDFRLFIYIQIAGFLKKIEVWVEATRIMVMKPKQQKRTYMLWQWRQHLRARWFNFVESNKVAFITFEMREEVVSRI
jgi:hypothetical protein